MQPDDKWKRRVHANPADVKSKKSQQLASGQRPDSGGARPPAAAAGPPAASGVSKRKHKKKNRPLQLASPTQQAAPQHQGRQGQQQQQQQQQQQHKKKKKKRKQAAVPEEEPQQPQSEQQQSEQQQQRKKMKHAPQQPHAPQRPRQLSAGDSPSSSGRGSDQAPLFSAAAARLQAQLLGGKKKQKGGGAGLLDRMRARLQGGRFRWLNEQLYTSGSGQAAALVAAEPEMLAQYHEGFREQTRGWPVQPVELALRWLSSKPPSWAVADLGCGDARIAAAAKQKVHSFDLAATAPGVIACNIADVPLRDGAVDAAIFCLSLMGTDYGSFLDEAARILKPGGWLWIAEVASRFAGAAAAQGGGSGSGGSGGGGLLPPFVACLRQLGFELRREDKTNTHFFVLELQKVRDAAEDGGAAAVRWPALKPCTYKKR